MDSPIRITRLKVEGFRRLSDLNLECRPLTVLIGANGVGKSSILDIFKLLAASASGKLSSELSALGGMRSILTRTGTSILGLELDATSRTGVSYTYQLRLQAQGVGHLISQEFLTENLADDKESLHISSIDQEVAYRSKSGAKQTPDWDYNNSETALSQVPKTYKPLEAFRRVLANAASFHSLDVGARSPVKQPQQLRPATSPGADGEDLVAFLYNLRESEPASFDSLLDAMKSAFPSLESLGFPPVAAGTLAMTWKDASFPKPLYMHELSEGTLRFLWLASLLSSRSLPTVTTLDEPEVSLHPELLSILADLMREASKRTQLIVATHSDRLIRFLKPSEVVAMDMNEEGLTTATWADTMDLEHWLADYSLDEVWQMGRMGGRA